MILGIGTDLVENRRLASWVRSPGLLARYFTDEERADVATSTHPEASAAARFAAKEAFAKALGTGLRGLRLRDIGVRRGREGRPELVLSGEAQRVVTQRGGHFHLSLTHERDYSLAFVVWEA